MDVIICVSHVDMCKNLTKLSLNFLKILRYTLSIKVRGVFFLMSRLEKLDWGHVPHSPISILRAKSYGWWKRPPPPSILDKNNPIRIGLKLKC